MLFLVVHGVPVPQGSKTRTQFGGIREANPATRAWRQAIALEARIQYTGDPLPGPFRLDVDFYFARPISHYRTGKHAGELKDTAPAFHATRPDREKLARAVGDSLTGVVVRDDSQFADGRTRKLYGAPRAEISITPLCDT